MKLKFGQGLRQLPCCFGSKVAIGEWERRKFKQDLWRPACCFGSYVVMCEWGRRKFGQGLRRPAGCLVVLNSCEHVSSCGTHRFCLTSYDIWIECLEFYEKWILVSRPEVPSCLKFLSSVEEILSSLATQVGPLPRDSQCTQFKAYSVLCYYRYGL